MPVGTRNTSIPGCGMHHIALQTCNWDASLKLYRDVLGMEVVAEFGKPERKIALLDMGDGSHMELFQPTDDAAAPGDDAALSLIKHFALATTDTRASIEKVRQAGYEVTIEPKDIDLGALQITIGFFKGPNGEIIEFFQTH